MKTEQEERYIVGVFRTVRCGSYVMGPDIEVKKFKKDLSETKPDEFIKVHKVVLSKGNEQKI